MSYKMGEIEQSEQTASNIQIAVFTDVDKGFQAVKYFCTYHLKNETFEQAFKRLEGLYLICDKYIFSEEHGESGETPHIQGAFILKTKMRASTIQKHFFLNGVTLRKLKNWGAAYIYCRKEGNRIESNVKEPKPIKIISELYQWQKEIEKIVLSPPDDRTIYWFWKEQGCIGKSQLAKYLCVKHKCLFCQGGEYRDIMNLIFNNDMEVCPAVVFNLVRGSGNRISYKSLESIKDGLVCNTKYETGVKIFNAPHVIVFANMPPNTDPEIMSHDRWNVTELP